MARCHIFLTKMLNTHGNMLDASDKNAKYTWKDVTYTWQEC